MIDDDLNQLLCREQVRLLLVRLTCTGAKLERHRPIAHIFGRRVSALHYPYLDPWSDRWATDDTSQMGAA